MTELEKAARKELLHSYATIVNGELAYQSQAMFNMFEKGAQWHAKQSPWISVKERLPEEYEEVLAKYNVHGEVKYDVLFIYGRNEWCFSDMEEFIDENMSITHWMPIPSFDDILEDNKDVLRRINEKGD